MMKTMGYKNDRDARDVEKGEDAGINFEVEEEALSLDGVVVSANRNETTRRMAPSLVNVLDSKMFETTHATSLADRAELPAGRAGGKQLPELRFPTGAYQWTGRSLHADIGG